MNLDPNKKRNTQIKRLIKIYQNRTNGWNLCLLDLVRTRVRDNQELLDIIDKYRNRNYAFLFFCEDQKMHWDCTEQAEETANFLKGLLPVKPKKEKKIKPRIVRQKKLTIQEVKKWVKRIPKYDSEIAHTTEDSLCRDFIKSIAADKYKPEEIKPIATLISTVFEMDFDRWYA